MRSQYVILHASLYSNSSHHHKRVVGAPASQSGGSYLTQWASLGGTLETVSIDQANGWRPLGSLMHKAFTLSMGTEPSDNNN
jgi:hypothetical protein